MASPSVGLLVTSSVNTAGTSHTVTLPTGIVAGMLLRVVFGYVVRGQTISWPAGWVPIVGYHTEEATTAGIDSAYRIADGAEGGSISVGTSLSTKSAHSAKRYNGASVRTVPVAATGVTGSGTGTIDPPAITPAGGSKDYLIEADAWHGGENTFGTFPSGYGNTAQDDTGTTGTASVNGSIGVASLAVTNSTEDPGVFVFGSGAGSFVAQTVAIYPGYSLIVPQRPLRGIIGR